MDGRSACRWRGSRAYSGATPEQRNQVELSRVGLHWEALDKDISIAGLLAGRRDVKRVA
jgi:hypothetical protein